MLKREDENFWIQVKELMGIKQAAIIMKKAGLPIEDALAVLVGYGKIPN